MEEMPGIKNKHDMPNKIRCRKVMMPPPMDGYKPFGIPLRQLESVTLFLEEFEAIRLVDHEDLRQEEAAKKMDVSRPTFTRIINQARKKVAKAFVEGYKKELAGKEPIIPAVAALGYDAYLLVRDAIERAGSTDGVAIKDALNATKDFEGVTGIINFTKEGDADKNIAVIKTVKGGQFVYIDTVEVK